MPGNDREFFNARAEKDGGYKVYPDGEYRKILDALGILVEDKSKKLLEAGCGSGAFSSFLYEGGFTEIIAIDISDRLIKDASASYRGIKFMVGDILDSPFDAGVFDLVFCGGILHHFPDKLDMAAREFMRILKPGGKVYFYEPYFPSINSLLRYHIFSFNRTEEERAIRPGLMRDIFLKAGFSDFRYGRIDGVKHIYTKADPSFGEKVFGALRRFVNESLFPNTFFAGSCVKECGSRAVQPPPAGG